MTAIRREQNPKPELSELERFAKEHGIYFASDASDRVVFREIYKKIEESNQDVCKEFMTRFKQTRNDMIYSAIRNPRKLATWLYEEQGERRFDAVYRICLVLIDRGDLDYSWNLERNSDYLPEKISEFLDGDLKDEIISINFNWKERDYATKCRILFIGGWFFLLNILNIAKSQNEQAGTYVIIQSNFHIIWEISVMLATLHF